MITKADGYLEEAAFRAKSEYLSASKLMRKRSAIWSPKVSVNLFFDHKRSCSAFDCVKSQVKFCERLHFSSHLF